MSDHRTLYPPAGDPVTKSLSDDLDRLAAYDKAVAALRDAKVNSDRADAAIAVIGDSPPALVNAALAADADFDAALWSVIRLAPASKPKVIVTPFIPTQTDDKP